MWVQVGQSICTYRLEKQPTAKKLIESLYKLQTAESLGYITNPDAERIAAAELEARRSQGVPGEWQVIINLTLTPQLAKNPERIWAATWRSWNLHKLMWKQGAEAPPPDQEDARAFFKLQRKNG